MPTPHERDILSIATLLCDCNVFQRNELDTIMATAAHQSMTTGEYLYKNGLIAAHVVRSAIMCQLMLRRRWLTYKLAVEALTIVVDQKVSLEEALNKLHWNRAYFENVFQMSEMLLKSGLVSEKDLVLG